MQDVIICNECDEQVLTEMELSAAWEGDRMTPGVGSAVEAAHPFFPLPLNQCCAERVAREVGR